MNAQPSLGLDTPSIDLHRFVVFNPNPHGTHYTVGGYGAKRSGNVGVILGTVCLRHAPGYEVVLQFDDGTIESFCPNNLSPVVA